MNPDGSVQSHQRIDNQSGNLYRDLVDSDRLGKGLTSFGDLGGDGIPDLVVGLPHKRPSPPEGEVWILHLHRNGTVKSLQTLALSTGGFEGAIWSGDEFGRGLSGFPDFDGDGFPELLVGAPGWDQDEDNDGEFWLLTLDQQAAQATSIYKEAAPNPSSYRVSGNYAGTPVMGATVNFDVDVASTGHTHGAVLGYLGEDHEILPGGQILLMDISHPVGEVLQFPIIPAPVSYSITVPSDLGLCGLTLHTQGVHIFGPVDRFRLTNGIEMTVCN